MGEFLSAQEIAQKLHEFKESWYSIVKRFEALAEFSSALGSGVEKSLEAALREMQACEEKLLILNPSLKHAAPSALDEIEQHLQRVSKAIGEMKGEVVVDLENVRALRDIASKLAELERRLGEIESEERALAEQESKVCAKYESRKRYYEEAHRMLVQAAEKRISAMKKKFEDKASSIVQGYDVILHGKSYTASELFNVLLEKPGAVEDVILAQKKGFLGFGKKSEEERKIKTIVLVELAKETVSLAAPLKSEELRELAKLDAEFADLKSLENACTNARKRRGEFRSESETLRAKIQELKQSRAYSYANYDGLLRLRERYLKRIADSDGALKDFLSFAERSFSVQEFETDPEKRELKAELKKLVQRCEALDREKKAQERALRGELEVHKKAREKAERQVENLINEKLELQKRLEALQEQVKELQGKVQTLEEERAGSRDKLMELKRQIEIIMGERI